MISVVIPNYNRRDSVLALLHDVFAQDVADLEVIVVDDHSPDDSVEAIRREFPRTIVLVNEKNSGPAVTRNRGVLAANGEVIVGFDSDVTIPDRHLLTKVEERFRKHPSVSCLALRILKPDGHSDDVLRWCHPLPVDKFGSSSFLTSYFSGTAYAVKRDSMIRAGLYPEIFYMHYEEVELAFRLLDQGESILHCPDLGVLHHASEISSRGYVETFYHPRNQILMTLLSYPILRGVAYIVPRVGYQFAVAVRGGHLKIFFSAIRDAIRLSGPVMRIRKPLKPKTFREIFLLKSQTIDSERRNVVALPMPSHEMDCR